MRKVVFAAAVLLPIMTLPAVAEQNGLTGVDLRNTLSGKTLFLATPLGVELPIHYRSNGTMSASAGSLAGVLSDKKFVKRDRGVWWIAGRRLCQRWRNWLKARRLCFRLERNGRTVYWRSNDGRSGTARLGQ